MIGTFGTNRIYTVGRVVKVEDLNHSADRVYTVGRVVKVEDLMRFERFAPRGFDSLRISNAKIHQKIHI